MPQIIDVPGHGPTEFPDGMTDDQIVAAIRANPAPQQSAAPSAPIRPMAPPTATEKILSQLPSLPGWIGERGGAVGRLMMGAADPGAGLFQLGANAIGQGGAVNQRIADVEKQYQTSRQGQGSSGFDPARLAGNVGLSLLAPVGAAAPAGVGMNAVRGATMGAGFGLAQPVADAQDYWGEKLKQGGIGAAGGALSAPLAEALARVIRPNTGQNAQTLMSGGITLTPGQILGGGFQRAEDALTSVPVIGDMIRNAKNRTLQDFNRAAYNRALGPIGQDAAALPAGPEGVAAVKSALGNAYDTLLPKLTFKADEPFVGGINNLRGLAADLPPQEAQQFEKILTDNLSQLSNGRADGQTFKTIISNLGTEAKRFGGSTDVYQQKVGDALQEAQALFRQGLTRTNPDYAQQLTAIDKGYANYARIRGAAASAGDKSGGFTPAQLAAAVRNQDKSAGKGATATGTALMQDLTDAGRAVLPSTVADSGTPFRHAAQIGLGGLLGAQLIPAKMAAIAGSAALPAAAGLLATTLPYTATGQKLMQALLAQRPAGAATAADLMRRYGLLGGAAASPALVQ